MTALLLAAALASPPIHGVALAPHYEGVRTPAQVARMVDEIAALGANTVQIVVQWAQADVEADAIAPYRWGTDDAEVRRVIRHARAAGLRAFVFPILFLQEKGPGAWRGTLRPRDRAAWWAAYRRFVLHYARLAAAEGAELLSVGSELKSMERDAARWRALIGDVRAVFPGQLTYSANWDHMAAVGFWPLLDYAGLNAYHPITTDPAASESQLTFAWRHLRGRLLHWQRVIGRPLLFTEVGYPSVEGGAVRPYAFAAQGPVDLEEQRRAYAAFTTAWRGQARLAGAVFWLWSGEGGAADPGYTVRGKPAEAVLRAWFDGGLGRPPTPAEATAGRR